MIIDKDHYEPQRHNYIKKQMTLISSGGIKPERGRLTHISFEHDDSCGIFKRPVHYCDCDPSLTVESDEEYLARLRAGG
jgi:hypothetical protein